MLSVFSPPERPFDEPARQRAVDDSGLWRAPPDPTLHALAAAAARLFDMPMAAVSVVDRDRQWFAARTGLALPTTTRAASFCAHAILTPERPFVVPDAAEDVRFAGNPLVQLPPSIRFYAGAAVRGWHGQPIGTLCVFDNRPHHDAMPLEELTRLAERASRVISSSADLVRNSRPN